MPLNKENKAYTLEPHYQMQFTVFPRILVAQSAGTVEYTDSISTKE